MQTVLEPFKAVYSDPMACCAECGDMHNIESMHEIEQGVYACSTECFEMYFSKFIGSER